MLVGGEPSTPAIKLVILGNSGVGKTSLINTWITGSPLLSPNPTIGAVNHMQRLTIGDTELDLFLWDTAGQEQFASLCPLYVRSASVSIVVADFTDQNSFDKIDMWRDIVISTNGADMPLILAVNKVDIGEEIVSRDFIKQNFEKKFQSIFYVSATRKINVEELFMEAARLGLNYYQKMNEGSKKFMITVQEEKKSKSKCCK